MLAMGIVVGLMIIIFKQVQGLVSILGIILQFFTGGFIPLAVIPEQIRFIAYIFPHTWAYELLHYYTIPGWTLILPLAYNWIIIFLFFIFYTLIALFLHKKVVKHAKTKGLHLI